MSSSRSVPAMIPFLMSARVTVWKVGLMPIPSTCPPCGSISRGTKRRPGLPGASPRSSGNSRTRPASISERAMRDTAPGVRPTLAAISVRDTDPDNTSSRRTACLFRRPVSRWLPCSLAISVSGHDRSRRLSPPSAICGRPQPPVGCVRSWMRAASMNRRLPCFRLWDARVDRRQCPHGPPWC